MKLGDLVQHTIFDPKGSGGYGLVLSSAITPEFWNVHWTGYDDEMTSTEAGTYEVHEYDIIVVSSANTNLMPKRRKPV